MLTNILHKLRRGEHSCIGAKDIVMVHCRQQQPQIAIAKHMFF